MEELDQALAEAKPILHQKVSELISKQSYLFDPVNSTLPIRDRYLLVCDQLLNTLRSVDYTDYLSLLDREGRLQARQSNQVELVISQFSTVMSLTSEALLMTPAVIANPHLLRPLTMKMNLLRTQAEQALLEAFMAESQLIQQELAVESDHQRLLRLEQTSLPDLIKSIRSFQLYHYVAGQLIFQPRNSSNTTLYFIMSGKVRIYELLPDGRIVSLSILKTGDVFTQSGQRGSYFHDVNAEAMADTMVARIQDTALENLMNESPMLASRIVYSFSQQLSQSQQVIEGLLGRDISGRIARLLLKLADEFGKADTTGSLVIQLGLTHQELADMIGSNRVTITRKLKELEDKHLIKIEKGRSIAIIDRQALENLVA